MSEIKIMSAKLNSSNTFNVGVIEISDSDNNIKEMPTVKCDWIAHEDLLNLFSGLDIHLAEMSEMPEAAGLAFINEEAGDRIMCNSFTISGEDGFEKIMLSGKRDLLNGKSINLVSPSFSWDDSNPYPYMQQLSELIYEIRAELAEYYNGKTAPKRQLDLFAENLDEEFLHMDDEGVTLQLPEEEAKPKKAKERVKK